MDVATIEFPEKTVSDVEAEKTDALITVGQTASLLHVHINTVRKWSNLGILPSFRIGPRSDRRFRKKDVIAFLLK